MKFPDLAQAYDDDGPASRGAPATAGSTIPDAAEFPVWSSANGSLEIFLSWHIICNRGDMFFPPKCDIGFFMCCPLTRQYPVFRTRIYLRCFILFAAFLFHLAFPFSIVPSWR